MGKYTGFQVFMRHALKYGFSLWGTPKTGQVDINTDYDDGYYQKGYPRQGSHFTDNGDGTITDNATGLMWPKDGTGAGYNNGNQLPWASAIAYAEGLHFGGYSDWRLPNINELVSTAVFNRVETAVHPIFVDVPLGLYWSSTSFFSAGGFTNVADNRYGHAYAVEKLESHYVSVVRGGQ